MRIILALLILQGHQPIMLRTQYRCHPTISTLSNNLFYDRQLEDGVTAAERLPLAVRMRNIYVFYSNYSALQTKRQYL